MTLVDGVFLVSNSEVQTFKQCKRKWMLSWYRGLGKAEQEVTGPLRTGGRIHEALEAFYVPDGQPQRDMLTVLRECHDRDLLILAEQHEGLDLVPTDLLSDFGKAKSLEEAMITGYVDWLEESGEDAYLKIVSSEEVLTVPFDVPSVSVPVALTGKLDVRAIRTNNGQRVFLDHKTCAAFGPFEQMAPLQEQPLHYMLLEAYNEDRTQEADYLTTGVMYNLIRKVKRTAAAKPPFYKRLPVNYNTWQVEAYEDKLVHVIQDMWRLTEKLESGVIKAAYPSPTNDCTWKCDFFKVCGLIDDGSRYEDFIGAEYAKRNPLAHYESKGSE